MGIDSISPEFTCEAMSEFPSESPELFFDTINTLYQSARQLSLISAAVQTGLFSELEEWHTIDEISKPFPNADIIRQIILILVDMNLLQKDGERIKNGPIASVYLRKGSPFFQRAYLAKIIRHLDDLWLELPKIIKEGPIRYPEESFFAELSLPSMAENALTGRLQDVVRAVKILPGFKKMRKIIDLGGGHGLYAIALACQNPLLKGVVFDLQGVVHLAQEYIDRYGMSNQVTTMGGDFFLDPIGSQYDIILSSSNPSGKSPDMLKKIAAAMNINGYFINIQPGDKEAPINLINDLEWELWTFEQSEIPKKSWGKKREFITDSYRNALDECGLSIVSITEVRDPYVHGFSVTMLIAQKTR